MQDEMQNVKVKLEILHYRNGKLIDHVIPYEDASLMEKLLYHIRLKNLTRSA